MPGSPNWLAELAKTEDEQKTEIEPEIAAAVPAYARSLTNDDDGAIFERSARRLAECANDTCALQAIEPEGFGRTYARALPVFITKHWFDRASDAWIGIEAAHATLSGGPANEALITLTLKDLGIDTPKEQLTDNDTTAIDFTAHTPPTPHDALFSFAISARGSCFRRPQKGKSADEDSRVASSNLLGCLLTRMLVFDPKVKKNAPAHAVLVKELGEKDGARAFNLLLVHASAVIVTNWEPRHVSVDRMSARAVEEKTLHWLAKEWRGTKSEPADAFAQRYAAAWKTLHSSTD
jgi:hypothetical protein